MQNFFKNVFANIVAIFIVFAIFFMGLVFFIIISAMGENSSAKIKKNSVLTLDFKTNIIDSPTEDQEDMFAFKDKNKNVMIYDILEAIQKAKADENIKGISIETDHITSGITQLDDIREALQDFKKSGKFVYAYGNSVSQAAYYLGSVSDKYYLNPSGGIDLKGLATEVVFLKGFADKYGIGIDVIRHGKFKAAVEPFLRNDISPENKEQLSTLLNDIWSKTSQKIMASRQIDSIGFKTTVDSLYGIIPAYSLNSNLVDKLIQKSEYDEILKSKIGLPKDEDLNKVSFSKYIKTIDTSASGDNEVAVLYASGTIYNGEGYNEIYSEDYVQHIKELAADDNVKAVVFRINSPGGSANASDEILFELQQLKKKKPLIVSFGDYAASGGYYIAMAADKIYSEPNTLTGSIGVFGVITNFKELANKNGIREDIVATNANSAMYTPFSGLTSGTHSMLTKSIEQTYKRFVYFVTQNRKKSFEQIDKIAGGRVWGGSRAKELGLVDELGSLQDAIDFAAKQAKLSSYNVEAYPKKKSQFEQIFEGLDEDEISAKILKSKLSKEEYKFFEMISDPKLKSNVMMSTPYKVNL